MSTNFNKNHILEKGSKNFNKENWKVFHPNGKHMFTCGEKKANWYLERDLAKKVNYREIQFTFTPKGDGYSDNEEFGLIERKPICVVSGTMDDLQRHHIVPYCYRTHFPKEFKSKNHHDVVLINFKKHAEYELKANEFKNIIAEKYDVKTISEYNVEYVLNLKQNNQHYTILLNNIKPLFSSYGHLSIKKIREKLTVVSNNSNIDLDYLLSLNYIQLYKFYLDINDLHVENVENFKSEYKLQFDHGYRVVQQLKTEKEIKDFVVLWRKHFIDTMKPKFMPEGWSINFRVRTNL